jgi:hypothetical protein
VEVVGEQRTNVIRCGASSYALRKHVWERVVDGVGEQRTKAIRCGACYYSIVLNAHRVTSSVWPIPTLMPLKS